MPTRPSPPNTRLQKFLWAAPVAAAGLAGTQEAAAQVVVFPVNAPVYSAFGPGTSLYNINPSTGFSASYKPGPRLTLTMNPGKPGSPPIPPYKPGYPAKPEATTANATSGLQLALATVPSNAYLAKLSAGSTIGSGTTFGNYTRTLDNDTTGPWQNSNGSTAYAGIAVPNGGGDYYYGWLSLLYNDAGNSMTISELGFQQTAGLSILAGETSAIPEPATNALLLATGAAGLVAYRRRKAKVAA